MKIDLQETTIELLPDAAVLLPRLRLLVVADVHLGKATGLQVHGINVPEGDNERDLDRLSTLVKSSSAEQVIIAGDLFHTPTGVSDALIDQVNSWVDSLEAEVLLVTGNHDKRALRNSPNLKIEQLAVFQEAGLRIVHDPTEATDATITIAGHVHPSLHLRKLRMRVPCFHLSKSCLTLPAFGSFTGGQIVHPENGDRIFINAGGIVQELPSSLYQRS